MDWQRRILVLRRWWDIVAYATCGVIAFYWAFVVGSRALQGFVASPIHPGEALAAAFDWALLVSMLVALTCVVEQLLRPWCRRGDLLLKHPPLWIAVVLALGAVAGMEATGISWLSMPDPWVPWSAGLAAFGIAGPAAVHQLIRRGKRPGPPVRPQTSWPPTWEVVAEWAAAEGPAGLEQPDLFGASPMVARLVEVWRRPWGEDECVAILGGFGSGKTTIIRRAMSELSLDSPVRMWFAQVNCWGMPASSAATGFVLDRILDVLEEHVDTAGIRGLPATYQRLLAAEPTGILGRILPEVRGPDAPLDALRVLSPILQACNARIVVVLEDVDRAGSDFDPQHVQRVLSGLRDVPGVSFVVAIDEAHAAFDYWKLCDRIEKVPPLDVEHVRLVLRLLRERCLSGEFKFIDPVVGRAELDVLDLNTAPSSLTALLRGRGKDAPVDAICRLLASPRRTKHLVRRVERVWRRLHGEVDLDDLIALTALREGAPAAFSFIERNVDIARAHPKKDGVFKTPDLDEPWKALLRTIPEPEAAKRLVELLALPGLESSIQSSPRPQGVANIEPVDYFRRLLAEQVGPGEVRDQQVLADIDAWVENGRSELIARLVGAKEAESTYASIWEHFAERVPRERLLALAGQVLDGVQQRDGAAADGRHLALIALWRVVTRALPRAGVSAWVSERVRQSFRVSLGLANDLYYFWAAIRHGPVDDAGRTAIRLAAVEQARTVLADPEQLRGTWDDERPWELRRLVQPNDEEDPPSVQTDPKDWTWFGPPVLALLASDPDRFAQGVALLVGDIKTRTHFQGLKWFSNDEYTLNGARLDGIFGAGAGQLLKVLASRRAGPPLVLAAARQAQQALDASAGSKRAPPETPSA